jgi:hypothetical protein
MGWTFRAALSPALQRAYGWVGALLWAHGFPPSGAVVSELSHIALLAGGALAVPLFMLEAGYGRSLQAVARLMLAVGGVLVSHTIVSWLWQLNDALVATVGQVAGAVAVPAMGFGSSLIDLLVFGVPYLLMLVFLAGLLLARLAALALLSSVAPLAFLLGVHARLGRIPMLWIWQTAAWSVLPAAEAFILVGVRGLAGELSIAVPASDMLLSLVLLFFMLRLPFTLLGAWRRLLL